MKTTNLIIGIVTLSMIMFSCSMGTNTDAEIFEIQVQNPAHIQIAEVKPGETFFVEVEVAGSSSRLHETEPVTIDISPIFGNPEMTNVIILNDDGVNGDIVSNDNVYTCSYTLPYGNDEGVNAGEYDLTVAVKDIYNDVINEDVCRLNIKGLPPVIESATINNKDSESITLRSENIEVPVNFSVIVSTYNGHREGNNGFDENAGGYVKVEIPPELNGGVLTEISLYDDGNQLDEIAWDCEFNGSYTLKPLPEENSYDVTVKVRNTAGVEVRETLKVNLSIDYTYVCALTGNDDFGIGSKTAPYKTIQRAIDDAVFGVKVLPGNYTGEGNYDIDFKGKEISVESTNGAKYTIIDCQASETNLHRGFIFQSGETNTSVLKNFTIRKGYGLEEYIEGDSILTGGGILCKNYSSPKLEGIIIEDNEAEFGAGVACINNSNPNFINCEITNNKSYNNVFSGGAGLGIYKDSNPILENCLIAENNSATNGSGVYCDSAMGTFTNCSIVSNVALSYGGGLFIENNSILMIYDSIIWENKAESGNEIYVTIVGNGVVFKNTCMDDKNKDRVDVNDSIDFSSGGNISDNPIFEVGARGKFYLKNSTGRGKVSPCVDTGSVNAENLKFINGRTTSIQNYDDTGIVDMGYHYAK